MGNFASSVSSDPLFSPETGKEADFHKRVLLIGYGNIDRQDDGVAWHILQKIARAIGCGDVDPLEIPQVDCPSGITLQFALQLTPEMSDLIKDYDKVCFVDAHTGAVVEPVHIERLKAEYTPSPFTHHLTPASCLSLVESLHKRRPEGLLVSVRGYEFGFSQELSNETSAHTENAVCQIINWINS